MFKVLRICKVYNAVVIPTLLYGSEAWTTYKRHVKTLEKYHQRCLRSILRIKWDDFVSNNEVLDRASTVSIESVIVKNRLRWAGHVVRMDNTRVVKQVFYSELKYGQRKRGGQYKRFKDLLKETLQRCGIDPERWETTALDRARWQRAIHNGAKTFELRRRAEDETRKARRRLAAQAAVTATTADGYVCPVCGQACRSRIGLHSHMRRHPR